MSLSSIRGRINYGDRQERHPRPRWRVVETPSLDQADVLETPQAGAEESGTGFSAIVAVIRSKHRTRARAAINRILFLLDTREQSRNPVGTFRHLPDRKGALHYTLPFCRPYIDVYFQGTNCE